MQKKEVLCAGCSCGGGAGGGGSLLAGLDSLSPRLSPVFPRWLDQRSYCVMHFSSSLCLEPLGALRAKGVRQARCIAMEVLTAHLHTFVPSYHTLQPCPKDGASEVLVCTFLFKEKKVSLSLCTQVFISQFSLSLKTENQEHGCLWGLS